MQRIYFCCPISQASDNLTIDATGFHYDDRYSSKLVKVTSNKEHVLYVTEDWMDVPDDDNVRFRVLPLDHHFYPNMEPNGENYYTLLFPDHVKKHPTTHISGEKSSYSKGYVIEIHFDVDEDV